jgi:hypothetical protein
MGFSAILSHISYTFCVQAIEKPELSPNPFEHSILDCGFEIGPGIISSCGNSNRGSFLCGGEYLETVVYNEQPAIPLRRRVVVQSAGNFLNQL